MSRQGPGATLVVGTPTMNERSLKTALSDLPLGELRYLDSVGSTNDEALAWATDGAPDLSLVVTNEQTAGRGRLGRRWFTPPGTALAFSLILRPAPEHRPFVQRTVGLAALAIAEALAARSVAARIKWPNDVLILGRKVAGILVESVWTGEDLDCQVVGVGINVRSASLPHDAHLQFPATSLEHALGAPPDRDALLRATLEKLLALRPSLHTDEFLRKWEHSLAYLGERVIVSGTPGQPHIQGDLIGLDADGSLRLRDEHGEPLKVQFGDVSLRPAA